MTQAHLDKLKARLSSHLVEFLNSKAAELTVTPSFQEHVRSLVDRLATRLVKREWQGLAPQQRQQVVEDVLDEVVGFGPLGMFLRDRTVSEIMVNGFSEIFIERAGKLARVVHGFRDQSHLLSIIEKLLASVGRHVTQAEPYADVRLADGSRINIAIPPIAVGGPYITIRKFLHQLWTLDDLVQAGSLSPQAGRFLALAVEGRLNFVMSGAASSGKTTLLNALLSSVTAAERLIIIEDTVELQVRHPNAVRLATRPANLEGRGEITIRQLLKNALHMRPDRIIVGEVRGEETLDMLQAMNTGHEGSMTTLHANSPVDVFERIATMALMSQFELSYQAVRRQTQSAVDLIIHMERSASGARNVISIQEITSKTDEEPHLTELFTRVSPPQPGVGSSRLCATGVIPQCVQKLTRRGLLVPNDLFTKS